MIPNWGIKLVGTSLRTGTEDTEAARMAAKESAAVVAFMVADDVSVSETVSGNEIGKGAKVSK